MVRLVIIRSCAASMAPTKGFSRLTQVNDALASDKNYEPEHALVRVTAVVGLREWG